MSCRENISYLVPRDPSIKCWEDRVKLSGSKTKKLFQMIDEFEKTMGDNIKVYLRLKPSSSPDNPYTVLDSTSLQTEAPKDSVAYKNVTNGVGKLIHNFSFTSVLDQNTSQGALFKKCVVKNLKKFLSGENYLIMAYGTTSAGKTYTIQGDVENPGVIPRALDFVFNAVKDSITSMEKVQPFQYNEFLPVCDDTVKKNLSHKNFILSLDLTKNQKYPDSTLSTFQTMSSSGFSELYENITFKKMQSHLGDSFIESFEGDLNSYKCAVWISMIEIYNEQVYDLLEVPDEKGMRPKLKFRDDEYGNTFVKNLRYINVSSGHEAFQIFQFGKNNLHMAPTALNHRSSRSHCIFNITLAKFLDDEVSPNAVMSRFSFCDLAGMERAKKTLNIKDRLVESKSINTSLSILVKCLTTIKENQNSKDKKIIPYRESKLTKLFKEAVLGKEHFALIVNVTTESNLFDETLNVLKFSAIAQKIIPQNVFVKPKPMKAIKQSRFSRIVLNSSNNVRSIDWDSKSFVESKANLKIKEEKTTSEEDLLDLIDKLKEELAQEKKRSETIEAEIREELTTQFSEMLKKQRETNLSRLESETESLHQMYERREKRLVQYFEILGRENKRKKPDDEEYLNHTDKLKDLEKEVDLLRSENQVLKERAQSGKEETTRLLIECSELKLKLAEKERALEMIERTNRANNEGGGALEKELKSQLEEAQAKVAEFKSLLNEAAADYKELEEQNKYLKTESEILEEDLAESRETVVDLKNEINELQKLLSQKRIKIEKLEETNDKITEELKVEKSKTLDTLNSPCEKEVEILRKQLELTSEKLNQSETNLEILKTEKLDLEKDLELCRLKIADLESKVLSLEENTKSKNEEELEKKVAVLEEEIENLKGYQYEVVCLTRDKSMLEEKCNDLNGEIKVLQKELKDLITSNKMNSEKEKELENLSKTNEILQKELLNAKRKSAETEEELKKQIDELKTKERELKITLESLQAKFDAAEYQNSVLKSLKDEAEKKAYDLPELYEKINRLEKEVENRDKDLVSFTQNRQQIFNNYEKELSKLKDENERLRKDVLFANEVIAKNMTPLKNDKAEISRLKESVKKKDEEIIRLKAEVDLIKSVDKNNRNKGSKNDLSTKKEDFVLEQSSSKENSPFLNIRKKRNAKTEYSPDRLTKQIEALSLHQSEVKSTRKKVDLLHETIHPSTIKDRRKKGRRKNGRKDKEKDSDKETESERETEKQIEKEELQIKTKSKCHKQLFTENDFDDLTDLNASPLEPDIPRLRPRKLQ